MATKGFPKGKFIKVDAVRLNRNGTVTVKVPDSVVRRNPSLKRNIAGGAYGAGGVFHPFRSSPDYDPDRAGDDYGARTDNTGFTRRSKPKGRAKKKTALKKKKSNPKSKHKKGAPKTKRVIERGTWHMGRRKR